MANSDSKPIQIILYLGFDEESDEALQNAWEAVKELMDEGINVELIPYNVWLTDPTGLEAFDLPKIYINDELISVGRALSVSEIIFHVKMSIETRKLVSSLTRFKSELTT